MLSILIAAALATITPDDYFFMKCQEDFVIDNLPSPKRYGDYLPKEIVEQARLWDDPCWRCRKHANEEVIKIGEPAVRWLFWTSRSTNVQIQMHSNSCLRGLIKCRRCNGVGSCFKFKPTPGMTTVCADCWYSEFNHDEDEGTPCRHCNGTGSFERDMNLRVN